MKTAFVFSDPRQRPALTGRGQPVRNRIAYALIAFTRVELLIVLATLGLMGAVLVPAPANARPRSEPVKRRSWGDPVFGSNQPTVQRAYFQLERIGKDERLVLQ